MGCQTLGPTWWDGSCIYHKHTFWKWLQLHFVRTVGTVIRKGRQEIGSLHHFLGSVHVGHQTCYLLTFYEKDVKYQYSINKESGKQLMHKQAEKKYQSGNRTNSYRQQMSFIAVSLVISVTVCIHLITMQPFFTFQILLIVLLNPSTTACQGNDSLLHGSSWRQLIAIYWAVVYMPETGCPSNPWHWHFTV